MSDPCVPFPLNQSAALLPPDGGRSPALPARSVQDKHGNDEPLM